MGIFKAPDRLRWVAEGLAPNPVLKVAFLMSNDPVPLQSFLLVTVMRIVILKGGE